jgi:dTDP-4-amino-4,6-dideoxygalactose transaminase
MSTPVSRSELAINGGPKAVTSLADGPPRIGLEELRQVLDVWPLSAETRAKIDAALDAETLTAAPHLFRYYAPVESKVSILEREFGALFGSPYCLAVNSGTSALITSLVALGIGPGDEVIVPAYTFFASPASIVTARAIPVITEVDETLCLDPNAVADNITDQTKAIMVVHMAGMCADMDPILEIARERNLKVIEDCAQAEGGTYRGKHLGTLGDCGAHSFDFYKLIAAGEGGMVTCKDEYVYMRAQSWHDTAACWRPNRYAAERRTGELFAGENYRMNELAGAVALGQLAKNPDSVKGNQRAKQRIMASLDLPPAAKPQRIPDPGEASTGLVIFVPSATAAEEYAAALRAEGIGAGGTFDQTVRDWHWYVHWEHILEQKTATPEGCPYTCGFYKGKLPEYSVDMCPNTRDLLMRAVRIGISAYWTDADCDAIAAGINKVAWALLAQQ